MSADSHWLSLPGSLELKATGYQIRLVKRTSTQGLPMQTFAAFDPDGNLIASTAGDLDGLKQFAEQQARHRQEFDL